MWREVVEEEEEEGEVKAALSELPEGFSSSIQTLFFFSELNFTRITEHM